MNTSDHQPIITIALMAAMADGRQDVSEQEAITAVAAQAGLSDLDGLRQRIAAGTLRVADVASQLSDDAARRLAYETAVVVANADGAAGDQEQRFLAELRSVLGLSAASVQTVDRDAAALGSAALAGPAVEVGTGAPAGPVLDDLILRQAMLTGALELLPDRLANMAIIPIQLRLVYQIGQRHGQQLDANQIKDLAGTLGIGAAAQVMEGVVRGVLGGLARGLLGGMLGGATGVAVGAAVSFAATYALGHVAQQYYAQGRKLSQQDLRTLFAKFQQEARGLFPTVQSQIQTQASSLNLQTVMATIQGK
ncbi:MAG: GTPase [Gemmatimonadota bacterium]